MRSELPGRVPLVCLRCRVLDPGDAWSLHTLEVARVARAAGEEVLDGVLRCVNPACGAEYPVIDGVAIVHPEPATMLERDPGGLYDVGLDPEVLALLGREVPDGGALSRQLETMSIYLDGHWGDFATPAVRTASPALVEAVAARGREAPAERALELGASVGRWSRELASESGLVVAVDHSLAALRRARRILAGEPLAYARRVAGRHYQGARIVAPPAKGRVLFVCADALDPPFPPATFERVVALNLLDVVMDPPRLLTVAAALCRPGGELLLSSPYAWQSGYVAEDRRLGGADPAAAIASSLRGSGLTVEDEGDADWVLRRDDRASVAYRVHVIRARRTPDR